MRTANRWDRPEFYEFDFGTHVHCACGAVETFRSWGLDSAEARKERERLAIERAAALGWDVAGEATRCPGCLVVIAHHP